MGTRGENGGGAADVFVSYSRADEPFVRRLDAALRERGLDPWVDWEDIPPTADWLARVHAGIDAARAFVAVLSPEQVASEVCREELGRASAANKRLVPILHRQIDRALAPRELLVPNWIFFRDGDDFDGAVAQLVNALETDLDWLEAHARMLVRAREWERAGRDGSFLLHGSDLREAEAWLAEQGSHGEAATPLQADYIVASRRASARRQRLLLAGVGVALGVSIVLSVVALLQRNDARDQAAISRSRELAATSVTQLDTDPELSLLLARQAVDVRATPQAEDALVRALRSSNLRLTMQTAPATNARFSPDGSRIVAVVGKVATIRDARTGRILARLRGHRAAVHDARWSADGSRIVTASADGSARVWDARTGRRLAVLRGAGGDVTRAELSPDGTRVVTAARTRGGIWNARTGRPIAFLSEEQGIKDAALSADGRRVATTSPDGYVAVWDARTGRRVFRVKADLVREPVYSPSFSPDGKLLINAGWSDLRVWNARSGRLVKILHAHAAGTIEIYVQSAQFSDNGWYAVSAGADGTAIVWSVPGWSQVAVLRGHSGTVDRAEFSRDTRRVVTIGDDGTARVWDTVTGAPTAVLRVPGVQLTSAHFAPDGNRVVTAGEDGVRVWEASGFAPLHSVRPAAGPPARTVFYLDDAVFSPDGRTFATRKARPPIELWSVATGRRVLLLPGHGPARQWPRHLPTALAFSADGSRIVSLADDRGIIWDARTGRLLSRLRGRPIWTAAFTADGREVLTTGRDGWARVWASETGRLRRSLKHAVAGDIEPDAFSPDGRHYVAWDGRRLGVWDVATGRRVAVLAGRFALLDGTPVFSRDGTLVYARVVDASKLDDPAASRAGVWDTQTGAAVSSFRPLAIVREALFSADGRLVLTREPDTAELWETRTGERLAALRGHGSSNTDSLTAASFDPAGTLVLTAGADGTAKVWDARTGQTLATLRQTPQVEGYGVPTARFSPDGSRLLVVDAAEVNVYACEECGTAAELVRLADKRIARGATNADRARLARITR